MWVLTLSSTYNSADTLMPNALSKTRDHCASQGRERTVFALKGLYSASPLSRRLCRNEDENLKTLTRSTVRIFLLVFFALIRARRRCFCGCAIISVS